MAILGAAFCAVASGALAQTYSTEGVSSYNPCGIGPDLPLSVPEANLVNVIFALGGLTGVTNWRNGDVWGSDFRDGTDNDPNGGSDAVYFYAGHGICEAAPGNATDGDFTVVCGNFGKPDTTTIGSSTRWGNPPGRLRFGLLDASCPMDLPSLANQWFPVLQGVHVATGHWGDTNHDTLDSVRRGSDFAFLIARPSIIRWLIPDVSVGDAWMWTGLEDVQDGTCAVALAAGSNQNDAIDRRENERISDNRGAPATTWAAWKWVCK
jgi:hypothetical protein